MEPLGKLTAFARFGVWVVSPVAEGLLPLTMLRSRTTFQPHQSPLWWLAAGAIFGAFGMTLDRGVAMQAELDTVI
jgi:hypothetical protein